MKIIRHWLKIYDKEFLSYYKYIITFLLMIAAFLLGRQRGILLMFLGSSLHAYHMTILNKQFKLEPFLRLSRYCAGRQNLFLLVSVIARNFVFIITYFIYLFVYFKYNIAFTCLFTLLLYVYSTLFGIFIGKICPFYYLGLIIQLIFTILFFVSNHTIQENYLKFFSPNLQLFHPDTIHVVNMLGIGAVCIFLCSVCFWSDGNVEKNICLVIALIAVLYCLLLYEKNHPLQDEIQNTSQTVETIHMADVRYHSLL